VDAHDDTPQHLSNGHLSPDAAVLTSARESPAESGSDLSEPHHGVQPEESMASPSSHAETPDAYMEDMTGSEQDSEQDADGSVDADYEQTQLHDVHSDSSGASRTLSVRVGKSKKRKMSSEEEEYIRNNAELFGLRRSVSSTTSSLFRTS